MPHSERLFLRCLALKSFVPFYGWSFLKVPCFRGHYVTSLSNSMSLSRGLFLKVSRFEGLFLKVPHSEGLFIKVPHSSGLYATSLSNLVPLS